jgi:hypothetical protein
MGKKPDPATVALTTIVAHVGQIFLGGLVMMWLAPSLHEVLGTPETHPSYGASLAVSILAGVLFNRPAPSTT